MADSATSSHGGDLAQWHRRPDGRGHLVLVDAAALGLRTHEALHRRTPHPRRHDHVHADPARAELPRGVEHRRVQRTLRRRVRGLLGCAPRGPERLRADDHERAAGVAHHLGGGGEHVHGPDDVGLEHGVPVVVAGAADPAHRLARRDLDDAVDRAEARHRQLGERATHWAASVTSVA